MKITHQVFSFFFLLVILERKKKLNEIITSTILLYFLISHSSYNINNANTRRRKCFLFCLNERFFFYLLLLHLLNQHSNGVLDFAPIIRARRTKNFIFIVIVRPNSHHQAQVHRTRKNKDYFNDDSNLKKKHPFLYTHQRIKREKKTNSIRTHTVAYL